MKIEITQDDSANLSIQLGKLAKQLPPEELTVFIERSMEALLGYVSKIELHDSEFGFSDTMQFG